MLNFGHTFAHAIESSLDNNLSNKTEILRHGEAVGLGLLCEIYYKNGKNKIFYQIKNLLDLYSLPTNLKFIKMNKSLLKKEIFKYIFLDKKNWQIPKIYRFEKYWSSENIRTLK